MACNSYPDDEHYIAVLKQEVTSIIKRLRKHACIALWCGGNELFNSWSGMTDQSLALRTINSLCLQYDKQTPFIATSPLFGMAHGNYIFKWEGKEVFNTINKSKNTAYSEFGMPGVSPLEVLTKIIPANELFPPKEDTAWQTHHALYSWDADSSTWLCQDILTDFFGKANSIEELIRQSQTIQSEGYKAIFEEARRQKPYCSMALNWCFNEPWPAAANTSLIAYPTIPKPALTAVKKSCRPICASARFSKFVWNAGEYFFTDIWLLNDSFKRIDSKTVIVKIQTENNEITILEWKTGIGDANQNIEGPTARFKLPDWNNIKSFKVAVEVTENPEYNSEYLLLYQPKRELVETTAKMNV